MVTFMMYAPIYAKIGVSTTNCVILLDRQNVGMRKAAAKEAFYAD
jgi:hypothetical protein